MNLLTIPKITITDAYGRQILSRPFTAMGVIKDGVMTFEPHQWAPGVFCGMEFSIVSIDNRKYRISFIDYQQRRIGLINV